MPHGKGSLHIFASLSVCKGRVQVENSFANEACGKKGNMKNKTHTVNTVKNGIDLSDGWRATSEFHFSSSSFVFFRFSFQFTLQRTLKCSSCEGHYIAGYFYLAEIGSHGDIGTERATYCSTHISGSSSTYVIKVVQLEHHE